MQFIRNILNSQLFKISSLNTVSVIVRVASGLVAAKVLALFIGPAGLAVIGNFRNALTAIDTVSTLGVQNGIIKYVAEYEKDHAKLKRLLSTVFISLLGLIILLSAAFYFLSNFLSEQVFDNSRKYEWIFRVLAFTLPWHAANIIFMAVINGLGRFKEVIYINMAGNIAGIIISSLLIWQWDVSGALLGLIISPALLFVFSCYQIQKQLGDLKMLSLKGFDSSVVKKLLSYSFMSLVTALLGPVIMIAVRNAIIENAGIESAGFWEAINRISYFYLLFVSTLLTIYFLPKLSVAQNSQETRQVFYSYYKSIFPLFIAGCIIVYLLRHFIVRLLFTPEFLPMENLFIWQLLGDVLKVASLILGYQFFAKKMTKAFIVTEVMSFVVLYFTSIYFVKIYGAEGAVIAHMVTYGVYFLVLVIWFRKFLFR